MHHPINSTTIYHQAAAQYHESTAPAAASTLMLRRNNSDDSLKRSLHESIRSSSSASSFDGSEDNDFFTYEEECAPQLRIFMIQRLEKQIYSLAKRVFGKDHTLCFRNQVNQNPLWQAVDEILRLSEDEPYGVRGASILVKIKSAKTHQESILGTISMDESTISTFKIVLILQEESKMSLAIRNWFGSLAGSKPVHMIGSDYMVKKLKLYRTSQNSESLQDSYCP